MNIQFDCIAPEELNIELNAGKQVIIIDVRSLEEYNEMHIPMALNIPLDQLELMAKAFDPSKTYVTVCGKGGGRSATGKEKLSELGFHASYLCGGTVGWFEHH